MMTLLLTVICFLSGSLMFSYWIGFLLEINIRATGDGNPGAANLWKEAGAGYGLLGIALDFGKGYLPVFLIIQSGAVSGYGLVPVALAPVFGHAFSPFLKGNGGKSLAVSFGVWSALTKFRASLTYALILASLYVITKIMKKGKKTTSNEDGIQTTVGFLLLAVYLFWKHYPGFIHWIWLGNFSLLFWKNKHALAEKLKRP